MSVKDTANETSAVASVAAFLNATPELIPVSSEPSEEKLDFLPIVIALICICLLLVTCLLFVILCKSAALNPSCCGPREFMPYHPADATEPQLRLWKRLGSLRHSVHSVKRSQLASQARETYSRKGPINWSIMESTAM